MSEVCDECYDCKYYIANTDEGWDCVGQDKPCHEFIEAEQLKEQK